MRIAHVISTLRGVGGGEKTVAQLVRYGHEQSWDQLVLNPFALFPEDPETRAFYAPALYEGRGGNMLVALPSLRRWVAERLRSFEPDVVHAHLFHASVLVASLRRPGNARLVLSHQHGDHFQAIGDRRNEVVDRLAGRRYDVVVGCSEFVRTYLIEHYRYPPERVRCVRNGWEGNPLPRSGTDNAVICIARFRAQKNHQMLVEAVAQVREDVPDLRLRLVGDGDTRPEIEAYVNRLGLQGTVDFLGAATDVWPLLADARVFSLASHYEPLGIAALEAMAAGVPVVATAVGGLREIVEDGRTGFLVSPTSPDELADRLLRLLTDRQLVEQMGRQAQEAAQQFRSDHMAARYAEIYAELLRGRDA